MVHQSLKEASLLIAPAWDTRDFVAVNPFFGQRDKPFLSALRYVEAATGEALLPDLSFFKEKYINKEIRDVDLTKALEQLSLENEQFISMDMDFLKSIHQTPQETKLLVLKSLSDCYDDEQSTNKTEIISQQISKYASAYFDEVQALWKMPLKNKRFYYAWRTLATFDSSLEGVSPLAQSLPKDPLLALEALVKKLTEVAPLSAPQLTNYFFRLLTSVQGWSSYFQKFEFEATRKNNFSQVEQQGSLVDLLAVRMAYDMIFLKDISNLQAFKNLLDYKQKPEDLLSPHYIWLLALENSYRREVLGEISKFPTRSGDVLTPQTQMIFCIDVRSEVIRRNIEKVMPECSTLGFAGFFGLPIDTRGLGHQNADQQCPVLLNSVAEVQEVAIDTDSTLIVRRRLYETMKTHFKKKIQSSTSSCFTFVEVLGINYLLKLLKSAAGQSPNINIPSLGLTKTQELSLGPDCSSLHQDTKNQFAWGALKNMGLTDRFAPIVIFFGHGSQSANNPYASGLDCGACAGHNGLNNARVLADLLNDTSVRDFLKQKNILIPEQTLFVSGWHNTTLDELRIDPPRKASNLQFHQIAEIRESLKMATTESQKERAQDLDFYMGAHHDLHDQFVQKANDWSEIRPEWGLARNAAFIVGPRNLTKNANLKGRSFLHEYNAPHDHDLSVLELIMTAPMIVTNWINMQYYASTVSPTKFGSGNKVLHNVMSGIGCILGNSSDLLGGLSEQSVHYKGKYFHEPMRLQVFIQAAPENINQVMAKHKMVQDLVQNGWLRLISLHPETQEAKLYAKNSWERLS